MRQQDTFAVKSQPWLLRILSLVGWTSSTLFAEDSQPCWLDFLSLVG
jgi:hypothetical protein